MNLERPSGVLLLGLPVGLAVRTHRSHCCWPHERHPEPGALRLGLHSGQDWGIIHAPEEEQEASQGENAESFRG